MAGSGLNAWNTDPDPETLNFHLRQWAEPYRSTVHFAEFIKEKMQSARAVIDAGCGGGAPTAYLAEKYRNTRWLGLDEASELLLHARVAPNLAFEVDSLENLHVRFGINGVVLLATLSWMENYEVPLHQIATRIRPDWIAASTLLYDGNIDARIIITEHERPRQSYHNVYALPGLTKFMNGEGYGFVKSEPFRIDIDLPKPNNPDLMGSYTLEAGSGRIVCSGPLILPWHFVMYERRGV